MFGLSTKELAIVVTALLHVVMIFVFSFYRIDFDADKDWSYLKMSMKEFEIPKEVSKIEEVLIPANYEEHGLDQRKYSVAQTNKAVNEATNELSKGQRDKMAQDIDAEIERQAREASQSGFFDKGKSNGSLTGTLSDKRPEREKSKEKVGNEKGKADLGNTHNKATNITYYLKNRTEGAIGLQNPVYLCEVGGKVVVDITVNQFGDVISARVNTSLSETKDACLFEAAKESALLSTFNEDQGAEEKQRGSITYVFMAQ
ncbi:MAG: hypothetical protein KDC83_04000 [Flavobacteriales bacterium]|nr:hypothetical protein [Flavobacteriales bacterium]